MAEVEDVRDEIPSLLLPCVSCTRTFRPEALAVHSKVCEKTLIKKRKKFDSFKQRVQGTDLAEYLPVLPTFTKKPESSPVRKQSKWKDKHNELLQTIHAPTSVVKPSDHERCPYCERSFGPKAYDRHLEWCREQQVRVQPKSPASQRAKERLEARTKYRAPLAAKGKQQRSASRDKCSSGLRDPSPAPAPFSYQAPRTPATARKKAPYNAVTDSVSTPNVNQNFVKGTVLRSSTRTAPAAAKKTPQTRMSRYPRPYSSLRLNTEEVNDQVPEMSVTGFGRREMYLGIPVEVVPSLTVPYQLISTYDLDFPDDFVGSNRPSVCRENRSPDMSPVYPESPTRLEVAGTELNKTYIEDGLEDMLACNTLKTTVHTKTPRKRVKNVHADKMKNRPKSERLGCEIYDDLVVEKPFKESVLLNQTNQVNSFDLSKKTTSKVIPDGVKRTEIVQCVNLVSLVSNAANIVIEVKKLSSRCDPGSNLSSCKSYLIYSQSYLPRSFPQIILEFPGVNLIKDRDLFRNYVFFHVMSQLLNDYGDSHNLKPVTEAIGIQSVRKAYEYRSSPTIAQMGKYYTSCFMFSGCCSKEDLIQKSEVNVDRDSRNLTSPKKCAQRSKVRSSRTFTKVVHNWWDPTPSKKIKRYLSPDSLATEKSLTSESETYWDYYDMDKNCESDAIMPIHPYVHFGKPRMIDAQSPRFSDTSSEDRFAGRDPRKCQGNLFNYYSLCSKAPDESSCESVDSRGSFEEDSLNRSSDCSVSLEEVCWNNKRYYVPSSSKYGSGDIGNGEYVRNEKLRNRGRNYEFNLVSGKNRTDESENYPRTYSEKTTTVVEVEGRLQNSASSSLVRFQTTNTKKSHNSKYISQNAHGKSIGTSWSMDRIQVATKNQYEYSDNIFIAQDSLKPGDKAHLSKLPQINKVKTKSNQMPGVPINKEVYDKRKLVIGDDSSQSSVNSSCMKSKYSSKLPILQHNSVQAGQSNKTHWTNKHLPSKKQNFPPKVTSEEVNKPGEYNKMYENLRAFAKAPVNKDTDLFNFRRKLSPIAPSESISCSKSFSSERSSAYDHVNTSFVDELEEFSNMAGDRPYEIKIEQLEKIDRDVCPERSTLLTVRVSKEKTFSNHSVLPEISVEKNGKKERCVHCGARYKQRMKFPNAVKKVVSRISTEKNKKNNQFEREPYDLYKSAEEQMLKLLEPEKEPSPKPVSEPKTPPTPVSPPLFTSDISAFSKFTPIQTPSPLFISEDDNVNDPSKPDAKSRRSSEKSDSPLTITYSCDNRSVKDSNENPITLSTLSLCSSISIESVDSNKNGYRMALASSAKAEKKTPVPLRRTVSAFESRKETPSRKASKGRDPSKGRLKMEDMLYGSSNIEGERYFGSASVNSFLNDNDRGSSGSLEKAVSDAETLSAEQELLKSMSEFEKIYCSTSSSPDQSSQSLKFPSLLSSFPIESQDRFPDVELQPAGHPANGSDSAYSSLNRKSPVGGDGEGGARFCHECGAKYPLAGAKFCCQCGVRRLIL